MSLICDRCSRTYDASSTDNAVQICENCATNVPIADSTQGLLSVVTQGLLSVDSNCEERVVESDDFEENSESDEELIESVVKNTMDIIRTEGILKHTIIQRTSAMFFPEMKNQMSRICDRCLGTYDGRDQQGSSKKSRQWCEYCELEEIGISLKRRSNIPTDEFGVPCCLDPNHTADLFCKQCNVSLCASCGITHMKNPGHKLIQIAYVKPDFLGLLPYIDVNYDATQGENSDLDGNNHSYEQVVTCALNNKQEIEKNKSMQIFMILKVEAASATYNTEDAIDIVEIEQKITNHFKYYSEESQRRAMKVWHTLKRGIIEEYKRERDGYLKIDEIHRLEQDNDKLSMISREVLSNNEFDNNLTARIREQRIEDHIIKTKIFEHHIRGENIEIMVKSVNWNPVIVFGEYYWSYTVPKSQKKQYSGNRVETSNGVVTYWKGKQFKQWLDEMFRGLPWFELLEKTQLVFTMPNNFPNDEFAKINMFKERNINAHFKIGVLVEKNDIVDKELRDWLLANDMRFFIFNHDKLKAVAKGYYNKIHIAFYRDTHLYDKFSFRIRKHEDPIVSKIIITLLSYKFKKLSEERRQKLEKIKYQISHLYYYIEEPTFTKDRQSTDIDNAYEEMMNLYEQFRNSYKEQKFLLPNLREYEDHSRMSLYMHAYESHRRKCLRMQKRILSTL